MWRASDHDQAEVVERQTTEKTALPTGDANGVSSPHSTGSPEVGQALAAWAKHCMRCHGQIGAGDGPNGPQTGARNLTDSAWQARTSDAQIEQAIRSGRGQMPAFQLEPAIVSHLVRLIRQMGATGTPPTDGADKP